MKTSSKVMLAASGVATFLLPMTIGVPVLAVCGGILAYRGVKHVSKNYVPSKRQIFFKGQDRNRQYVMSSRTGLNYKELLERGEEHKKCFADGSENTGFVPIGAPRGDLEGLNVTTINPTNGKRVVVQSYDAYNEKTGCVEIETKQYTHLVKQGRGRTMAVRCDRVSVKLDRHGNIDWGKLSNRNLFRNPDAVAEVLKRYPESFETIPNEILHQNIGGISMGDYLCGKVKREILDRKSGASPYWSDTPRRQDGTIRSQSQYFVDIHKMMQDKVNMYAAQYGTSSTFKSSVNAWTAAPSTERYF